jgi:chain length determinant protein tyrosine kinase EpsG
MESIGRVATGREEHGVAPELRMYSLIGAHMREQGLLDAEQVEAVLRSQQQTGLRFGDEAVRLGLLTRDQVGRVLRRQFNVSMLAIGDSAVSTEVVAAYSPDCPSIGPIRSLRTILVSQHIAKGAKGYTLAIASPRRRDGRSLFAANLAVLFSQIGMRTLVIDANLRQPRQHELFGLPDKHGLSTALARHAMTNLVQKIDGLGPLAMLPAGVIPPNPEQLLGRPVFPAMLAELKKQFDVLIVDTPSAEDNVDALLVAEHATEVVVIARKDSTRSDELARFVAGLRAVKANVIGTILRTD